MKITQRQLRQVIREELMREMQGPPPGLGSSVSAAISCGSCAAFDMRNQTCKAFENYPVSADMVCEAWKPKS